MADPQSLTAITEALDALEKDAAAAAAEQAAEYQALKSELNTLFAETDAEIERLVSYIESGKGSQEE